MDTSSFSIIFLCIFIALSGAQSKLKVSIYYETLCSDSSNFIIHQFYPGYLRLQDKIEVEFIPYGKATHKKINGEWTFECQHGNRECYGNLMQACALSQTQDQTVQARFVKCIMSQRHPGSRPALSKCARNSNLSLKDMFKCAKDGTGEDMLAAYGDKTFAVEPSITFIPTIIYDDVFDAKLQRESLDNFCKTATKLIEKKKRTEHNF